MILMLIRPKNRVHKSHRRRHPEMPLSPDFPKRPPYPKSSLPAGRTFGLF
jgi:hypothetical protein